MIILSQDKTRITENMEIGIYPEYKSNKFEIDYYIIKNNCTELGIYKKEERAKEVLNEIMENYKNWEYTKMGKLIIGKAVCDAIYTMPEE